jgi:mycothiol synthase
MTTYTLRPGRLDDLEQAVRMYNLTSQKMTGADEWTIEGCMTSWTNPLLNIEADTRVAVTPDGKILGVVELWNGAPPYVRNHIWARVHPDYEAQGIGTALMQWAEARANEKLSLAEPDTRVTLTCGTWGINTTATALFQGLGYALVRYYVTMGRELTEIPLFPVLPEGLTLRAVKVPDEYAEFHRVDMEAERDHWGYVERPFADSFAEFMHYLNEGEVDPSLWFVAMDGGQMAGISMCELKASSDPTAGYVASLGVRQAYRQRGIGMALLLYSFRELYQRGQRNVQLNVDVANLTGALRLYERAGMQKIRQFEMYEKELRPGRNLMTRD